MANKVLLMALAALLAYVCYPFKSLMVYIIKGEIDLTNDCVPSATAPKLNLLPVRDCKDVDENVEPCIIRKAVSQQQLDQFIEESGDHLFQVREEPGQGYLGNPLIEARFSDGAEQTFPYHLCSFKDMINGKEECMNTYSGFKSLNYSSFEPLRVQKDDALNLEKFTRTDVFVGHPTEHRVTASFHSNNFEQSATLQVVGEKIWFMMERESYFGLFGAVAIGAYNAAANICTEDLAKVPIQAVRAGPGDIMKFPKAYPHHIYSMAGPNIMVNFRNAKINLLSPRDVFSVISHWLVARPSMHRVGCEDAESHNQPTVPTYYGLGHPNAIASFMATKGFGDMDMRCTTTANPKLYQYKHKVSKAGMLRQWDQDFFDQAKAFVGWEEPN